MKVLVTGSSGFIGTAVRNVLTQRGHECVSYDLPEHDIRNSGKLEQAILDNDAQAIINLAGMLGTPELFGHEAKAIETNIIGAINAYDMAAKYAIPIVQIGTGHKGQPNPYAITKGCAEDLGLCRAQYRDEKIAIVRAYHVYGPGQPVGPPHGRASVHKFFPTFACRAMTNMDLELCGGGEQLIDTVYVDDVAEVLVDAIGGPYGRVLEAGTGVATTVRAVAEAIRLRTPNGSSSKIVDSAGRDGEPHNAFVVASEPLCRNLWPYKAADTMRWYAQWLTTHS